MGLKNKGSAPVAGSDDLATTAYVDGATLALAAGGRYGSPVTDISGTDLNNLATTGFYRGSNLTNTPFGGTDWNWVQVITHDSDWVQQSAWGYTGGPAGKMYTRFKSSGAWQGWHQVAYTDSPALSGVPTAPTPATADNSTAIATTAFVKAQGPFLPLSGGTVSGGVTINSSLAINDLGAASQGFLNSSAIFNRSESNASTTPGTGSTTAFVTMNTNGTLGHLSGDFRLPSAYTNVITTRGLFVGSTGQVGTTSSARRTKNVHCEVDFDDAQLERWLTFPTVEFDYKADEQHKPQVGVIAEDVLEADPAFKTLIYYDETLEDPETKIDGFAYERMPVWNRMAIKRLLARVKDLEARIPA